MSIKSFGTWHLYLVLSSNNSKVGNHQLIKTSLHTWQSWQFQRIYQRQNVLLAIKIMQNTNFVMVVSASNCTETHKIHTLRQFPTLMLSVILFSLCKITLWCPLIAALCYGYSHSYFSFIILANFNKLHFFIKKKTSNTLPLLKISCFS